MAWWRGGVVFANELIVGKDRDAVEQKAESRFIDRVKEEDSELPTTKVVGFRFQQNALTWKFISLALNKLSSKRCIPPPEF